jgi:hypothetical protein
MLEGGGGGKEYEFLRVFILSGGVFVLFYNDKKGGSPSKKARQGKAQCDEPQNVSPGEVL